MNLAPEIMQPLSKMGVTEPTQVQAQVIPQILSGHDAIVVAQTGSGKTLAFLLPVLTMLVTKPETRALILAPSREIAEQILKVCTELLADLAIVPCLVIGGIPNKQQVSQLKKKPRVIVSTPGRLNDHLLTNKLLLQKVAIVVIDEADRMLDMGFAPQLKSIRKTMRGEWQTLMFSASFNSQIESMAKSFMNSQAYIIKLDNAEKPVTGLHQKVYLIDRKMKNELLIEELKLVDNSVIIFVRDQLSCEYVDDLLNQAGFSSDYMHGGLVQGHRKRVMQEFRIQKNKIMITTDLLARGLDVSHIECVINYDLPFKPEDFLHRIGRTARADRTGKSITFVTPEDHEMHDAIKKYLVDAEVVKRVYGNHF